MRMNSVDLAQLVWKTVRTYSVVCDEHFVMLTKKLSLVDSPDFVIANALRRLRYHHSECQRLSALARQDNPPDGLIEYLGEMIAVGPLEGYVPEPKKAANARAG